MLRKYMILHGKHLSRKLPQVQIDNDARIKALQMSGEIKNGGLTAEQIQYTAQEPWAKNHIDGNVAFPQHFKAIDYFETCAVILNPPDGNNWHTYAQSQLSEAQLKDLKDEMDRQHYSNDVPQFSEDSEWSFGRSTRISPDRLKQLYERAKFGAINLVLQQVASGPQRPHHEVLNNNETPQMQSWEEIEQLNVFFNDPKNTQGIQQIQEGARVINELLHSKTVKTISKLWYGCMNLDNRSFALYEFTLDQDLQRLIGKAFQGGITLETALQMQNTSENPEQRAIRRFQNLILATLNQAIKEVLKKQDLQQPFGLD